MARPPSISSFAAPETAAPPKENAEHLNRIIEDDIKKDSAKRKEEKKREVRVMLLGQAESGKSTLRKQFQICYASKSLEGERPCWKPVVYFNITKAVRLIFNELEYQFSEHGHTLEAPKAVQQQISELRNKLLPLIALEDSLASHLNGGVTIGSGGRGAFVRSGWQALVGGPSQSDVKTVEAAARVAEVSILAAKTLGSSLSDVQTLWAHPTVKLLVHDRKVRLEDSAAFFLNEIARIAEPDYIPTTDDILNVRLQTLGVIEHSLPISMGGLSYNWKIYDVAGACGQRQAWVPYFDDATAIIFLAPISAYDQYLEEDPKINRIEDSLQLFSSVCSNQLLKDAHLVLLLNKTDLLRKKLAAGISISKYITSYGNRPNDYDTAAQYFKTHFQQVHKRKDFPHRVLWSHYTSMLDIKATQSIISSVGEGIIRKHISEVGLT
ncbi:G-alpha-domain-containing protein [Macrolepiota fuliginosa MF-IS2]|uniref:G-alpha-domain-containing protein n=1 Tax=Macrolepiota fuliginosa MF-IS2 TaxID=1400762 RepID=A0A9P5X365_9AGAR|nr:G-alpha-domain-containing protein [Macrolepiota fuliginosa MF-IS2]